MKKSKLNQWVTFLCAGMLAFAANQLCAAPLDEVTVQQQGNVVQATIKMTTPIHFLRYVPNGKSRLLEIFYEKTLNSDPLEAWVNQETRSVPATATTPAFTVITRDQATMPKLVIEFAQEVEFSVTPGADSRSFVMSIKGKAAVPAKRLALPLLPTVTAPKVEGSVVVMPEAVSGVATTVADPAKINQQGYELMQAGRAALAEKHYPQAVEIFNKLLTLPPNQYSQDAQEWVGVARERNGQTAKAKAEYELYLKVFAESPNVPAVQQRLADLSLPVAGQSAANTPAKQAQSRNFVQGGISSRYYFGQSTLQTTYPFNGVTLTDSVTFQDQSSLITNVDATGRYVNEDYDTRLVFREITTQNFLPKGVNQNRLNAAYVDIKNRGAEISAKVGRQSASGGGVLGRFDGVQFGFGSAQEWRINGVAGQMVDFSNMTQPIFYGVSADHGPMSFYLINQTIEGAIDRRALGAEYKYFATGQMAYAMVDYDIYFGALNMAMANGSMTVESTGTTYNFLADYRKSPSISLRNALNGAVTTSIAALQASITDAQVKQLALARTGQAATTQLGVTQKLARNWQLGGDIRFSAMGAYNSSGDPAALTGTSTTLQGYLPAYLGSGIEKTMTVQLIASNLYSDSDMTSLGSSMITSAAVQSAQSVFVYNRTTFDRDLFLDVSWNYYKQTDNYGGNMDRNMPMVRMAYQVFRGLSVDLDLGVELTNTTGLNQSTVNTRVFGSTGLRWDF